MEKVNLHSLNAKSPDYLLNRDANLGAIVAMANSGKGPLRLENRDGVPYIGVRSWKTFFFELFTCVDTDIREIERETDDAIEEYIDPFLMIAEKNAAQATDPKSGRISATSLLLKLRARAAGKSTDPKLGNTSWMQVSATEPEYANVEVKHAKVRSFEGKIVVPSGLSLGLVKIDKVVADCHLVAVPNTVSSPPDRRNPADQENKIFSRRSPETDSNGRKPVEINFYEHYLDSLVKHSSSIHTCVAVEVKSDTRIGASSANRNGAWMAASEFMKRRGSAGKPVSVLLCLERNLPDVTKQPDLGKFSAVSDRTEKVVVMSITEKERNEGSSATPTVLETDSANDSDEETEYSDSEDASDRTHRSAFENSNSGEDPFKEQSGDSDIES